MPIKPPYRSFVLCVLMTASLTFLVPLALSEFFKNWFGEFSPAEVAVIQKNSPDTLYLSGLDQDVSRYKLELTKLRTPEIVAIGSSRAMQVRNEFLNGRLVNWGGTIRTIGQLQWAAEQLIKLDKKPKLALIYLDPWWFNERYLDGRDIFVLKENRITNVFRSAYVLTSRAISHGVAKKPGRLGMAAIQSNQGYDDYGSFHYVARVTGVEMHSDVQFERTLRLIGTQGDRFIGAQESNPIAVQRWMETRKLLESNGITVVGMIAPLAPSAIELMRKNGRHDYFFTLASRLGTNVFDYVDPTAFSGADNCEFLDGFHGGEITYARMLLALTALRPALLPFINTEFLRTFVKDNSGLTSPITMQKYGEGKREIDFMKLGCRR